MFPAATWWPQIELMWVGWKTQCVAPKVVLVAWQSAHKNFNGTSIPPSPYVLNFTATLAIAKVSKGLIPYTNGFFAARKSG